MVEIETKYEGYIRRQTEETGRFRRMEELCIPPGLSFNEVAGLSIEIREKLTSHRPGSIGQASRIPGVTPASISMLMVHLRKIGAYG
jgi:tRNA uridine 5-carboxymethylaminomethyl modification enzyme